MEGVELWWTDLSFVSHLAESPNKLFMSLQVSFYMSHQ